MKTVLHALLLLALFAACGTTSQYKERLGELQGICAEQDEECLNDAAELARVEEEYERADRALLRQEAIVQFIANCNESGRVLIYICRGCSASESHKMNRAKRRGTIYVPKNAHIQDFGCLSSQEVMRVLKWSNNQ